MDKLISKELAQGIYNYTVTNRVIDEEYSVVADYAIGSSRRNELRRLIYSDSNNDLYGIDYGVDLTEVEINE